MREIRASFTEADREHEPSQSGGLQTRARPPEDADEHVERLFEDYAGRVYRYCLGRLDSPEEAEDALQATYLNAWRSLSGGVRPVSARRWLFSIAANVCSTMLRTRLGGATVELRSPEALDRIPTSAEPSDELLGLSAALRQLPERQRHALLLRDWRGLSYDEIAAELNSSYQAVETLLFRARKSVAAGLTTPEPAKVPVRARALAPLPLLLPLQHGVSAFKSALSASIAPMKVSLGIALGASAPLIAFGLLERGVLDQPSPPARTAAAGARSDAPTWLKLNSQITVPPTDPRKSARPTAASGTKPLLGPSSPAHADSGDSAVGGSSGHAHGPDPAPPPPEPVTQPPPVEEDPPANSVTICHHTGSKKNPDVTITIAAEAVDAHLAHGDELGACAS